MLYTKYQILNIKSYTIYARHFELAEYCAFIHGYCAYIYICHDTFIRTNLKSLHISYKLMPHESSSIRFQWLVHNIICMGTMNI